jgi:hypothetical protein
MPVDLKELKEFIELCIGIIEKEKIDPKQNDNLFKNSYEYNWLLRKYYNFEQELVSPLKLNYIYRNEGNWSEELTPSVLKENRMQEVHLGLLKIATDRGFDVETIYDDIDTEWFVDQYR